MAAKVWVTGPVAMWVMHTMDSTPTFLGHGERAPHVREHAQYNPVINDVGGSMPFDKIYCGLDLSITVALNRFDQGALNSMLARSRSVSVPAITPGYDGPGSMGTLVAAEGSTFIMWLTYPFAAKAPFVGMPAGYRFFHCMLDDDDVIAGSTNERKLNLTIHTLRKWNPADSNAFGFGSFTNYDGDVSQVIGLPIS